MQTALLERNNIYNGKIEGQAQLAKDVTEVSDLFANMSIMVYTQGDNIDNIEHNIMNINENIEQANMELIKANKYQKKKRKIKYIIYKLISICICIIIVIVIYKNKN